MSVWGDELAVTTEPAPATTARKTSSSAARRATVDDGAEDAEHSVELRKLEDGELVRNVTRVRGYVLGLWLTERVVIVRTNHATAAFDTRDGRKLWSLDGVSDPGMPLANPRLVGQAFCFYSHKGAPGSSLVCVDPATGSETFRKALGAFDRVRFTNEVIAIARVATATFGPEAKLVETPLDVFRPDGKLLTHDQLTVLRGANFEHHVDAIVVGGSAPDPTSGRRFSWHYRVFDPASGVRVSKHDQGPMLRGVDFDERHVAETVWAKSTQNEELRLIDRKTGAQLWNAELKTSGPFSPQVRIAGEDIWVGHYSELIIVDRETGKERARLKVDTDRLIEWGPDALVGISARERSSDTTVGTARVYVYDVAERTMVLNFTLANQVDGGVVATGPLVSGDYAAVALGKNACRDSTLHVEVERFTEGH